MGGPTKTLLPPGRFQERKISEKIAKSGPQIGSRTVKNGVQKRDPKIKRNLPPGPPQGSVEWGPKKYDPPRLVRNFGPRGRNIGGGNHMVAEKPHSLVAPDRAGAGGSFVLARENESQPSRIHRWDEISISKANLFFFN